MKIVNVNVIVVKDITMIKLKTLLVEQEQENKYPENAVILCVFRPVGALLMQGPSFKQS